VKLRYRHSGPRVRRGSRVTSTNGLVVDIFAGCGGASRGISEALVRANAGEDAAEQLAA
jgi:hypothetical protein